MTALRKYIGKDWLPHMSVNYAFAFHMCVGTCGEVADSARIVPQLLSLSNAV
jgi:hypothetical protein